MRRRPALVACSLTALALAGLAAPAAAQDPDLSGTYELSGRAGWWSFGSSRSTDATLTLERLEGNTYRVTRAHVYRESGARGGLATGRGTVSSNRLKIVYESVTGVTGVITGANAGTDLSGNYRIGDDGELNGWSMGYAPSGEVKKYYERGRRSGPAPDGDGDQPSDPVQPEPEPVEPPVLTGDVAIEGPVHGRVYLAGQAVDLALVPGDATLDIEGPARRDDGRLRFTGAGRVTLTVRHDGQEARIQVDAVEAEVVELTVQDAFQIVDAPAPHFRRAVGAAEGQHEWQPAAIQKDTPLKLSVTFGTAQPLSEPAQVEVVGRGGGVEVRAQVELQGGQAVSFEAAEPLTAGVKVNAFDLTWTVAGREVGETPLRVYTTLGPPVDNPLPRYSSEPPGRVVATKLHYELACTWAQGATQNVARGNDSICYKIDNAFRHHVAWKDYGDGGQYAPVIPHYPQGTAPPINYDDLPGRVSRGERSGSQIYYPPLEPDEDYEEYHHYRNNFGWWVLDNTRYTGGRCNQQASLICDLFGTVGIEAQVYYIERWGRGKETGRPMRRYYKSSRSDKSWNFHGVVLATLGDGSQWIYDGSGSWPPRINGSVDELFRVPNGSFVDYWNPWRYEWGGAVPESDQPDTYVGQDGNPGPGEWRGVPIQEGELEWEASRDD